MILRKPYAFIIKHFRAIHLIIFICLLFITYNISGISTLSNTLINTRNYTYEGATVYINNQIYLFLFIDLFLSGVLLWLLKTRKKPYRTYLLLVGYLLFVLIYFVYTFRQLTILSTEELTIDTLSLIRDLSTMARVPGYIFMIICFLRGIGFNLKQFNFSKDIAELKIMDQDDEEFELIIGQNNYKYLRFIRRSLREAKYYILENKFAITIFMIVIGIIFAFLGYRYYSVYKKANLVTNQITYNNFIYEINNTYMSNEDYNGNKISDDSKYIIVNLTLKNTSSTSKALDLTKISIGYKNITYYATNDANTKFYDLGIPYSNGEVLPNNTTVERVLIFKVPNTLSEKEFEFRVQTGVVNKSEDVLTSYQKIKFTPDNIDVDNTTNTYGLYQDVNTNVVNKNSINLTIKDYELAENYEDKYVNCDLDLNCNKYSNIITANRYNDLTMLIFDYNLNVDENAEIAKTFTTYNDLLSNYLTINYRYNYKDYYEKANIVQQSSGLEGKYFTYVNRNILKATDIKLIFNFRNNIVIIPLKENGTNVTTTTTTTTVSVPTEIETETTTTELVPTS